MIFNAFRRWPLWLPAGICLSFFPTALLAVDLDLSDMTVNSQGTCLLTPSLENQVGMPVDGVLKQVYVDRGDHIKAGQLLARMNDGIELAAVDVEKARVDFGERKLARVEDLKAQRLISEQEVDDLTTELKLSKLELNLKREQLKLLSLYSPIRGVVVDRFKNSGDLVQQEYILTLAQLDPLYVEWVLPVSQFGQVKRGEKMDVRIPLLNQTHSAKVISVDKVVNASSGTFRVRMSLANPDYVIPAGIRCQVSSTL